MTQVSLEVVRMALALPRPGLQGQIRMSPEPRPGSMPPPPPEHPEREAGVLILLYVKNRELFFVLMERTISVALHKGQISLPGGAREGRESLAETALREASEELGIDLMCLQILGEPLTPLYIPVSGFWVTPFVAYSETQPSFSPAPAEVFELIEVPVSRLLERNLVQEEQWEIRGEQVRVPFFAIDRHKVWGATAMILSEFVTMLARLGALRADEWNTAN